MKNILYKIGNRINNFYNTAKNYKTVLLSGVILAATSSCIYTIDLKTSYNERLAAKRAAEEQLRETNAQLTEIKKQIKDIYDLSVKEEKIGVPKQPVQNIESKVKPSKGSGLEQKTK